MINIQNTNYEKCINHTADIFGITQKETKCIVDTFLNDVACSITTGEKITLPYLGSFKIKETKKHRIKDINSGEYRVVPARKGVHYSPKNWIITQINE